MSNSCILFRKFHFLIGSFDHLCSTREISMWNCGTASAHKCCAIRCLDAGQGDEIRYIVSLSFSKWGVHRWYHYTRHWQIHMKLKQYSLENGNLLRKFWRGTGYSFSQIYTLYKYLQSDDFLANKKEESSFGLTVVRILIDFKKLDYIPDIGIPVWILRIPLNWRFRK